MVNTGDILAVTYSVRHGSGYRMILQPHHSIISSDDAVVVPMRRHTLWDTCRILAMGKHQLPYAPEIRWDFPTVAIIVAAGEQNPVPLPSKLYSILPVIISYQPYNLTREMLQWLGVPSHTAGVYTGRTQECRTVLPVRISSD